MTILFIQLSVQAFTVGGRGDGPSVYWLDKHRLAVEFAQGYAPREGRDTYLKSSDLTGQVTVAFNFK